MNKNLFKPLQEIYGFTVVLESDMRKILDAVKADKLALIHKNDAQPAGLKNDIPRETRRIKQLMV